MIPSFTRQPLIKDDVGSKSSGSDWSWINEPVGISKDDAFTKPGLLEQINTTADKSDYLWYSLRYRMLQFQLSTCLFQRYVVDTPANNLVFYKSISKTSSFCWICSVDVNGGEDFLDGSQTDLHVESLGHALHAFVNGKPAGERMILTPLWWFLFLDFLFRELNHKQLS